MPVFQSRGLSEENLLQRSAASAILNDSLRRSKKRTMFEHKLKKSENFFAINFKLNKVGLCQSLGLSWCHQLQFNVSDAQRSKLWHYLRS
jgi:hypothetical protein